jgi:hypothetical protein
MLRCASHSWHARGLRHPDCAYLKPNCRANTIKWPAPGFAGSNPTCPARQCGSTAPKAAAKSADPRCTNRVQTKTLCVGQSPHWQAQEWASSAVHSPVRKSTDAILRDYGVAPPHRFDVVGLSRHRQHVRRAMFRADDHRDEQAVAVLQERLIAAADIEMATAPQNEPDARQKLINAAIEMPLSRRTRGSPLTTS